MNFKKELPKEEKDTEMQYNFMNIEYDAEPIYDTYLEEDEVIIGFDEFEEEENDFSIIDYLEDSFPF